MGRSGSGNWYRSGTKNTTDSYLRLSINCLRKSGVLENNSRCNRSMNWSRGGRKIASIGYTINTLDEYNPKIQLNYTSNGESMDYPVRLTTTQPNYGGLRWWFICPAKGCGKRVGCLYGGRIFACRHCHNLAYDSQNEAQHFRILHKAQKIYYRLGGEGGIDWVPKPKHMHWKTYNRLVEKMEYYDNTSMMMAAAKLGLLDRR